MQRRFVQVDVFSERPYFGNPLAVVVDGDGLDTADMQRFAKWTNLSETTFLLPPSDPAADYRVRIFTPANELPFAGHPTLGSAHAWLAHGGVPRGEGQIVQECGAGLVPIRRDGATLAFGAPPLLKGGPADEATIDEAAESLGIGREAIVDAAWADNGPGWLAVLRGSADEVLAIAPRTMRMSIGVAGPHPSGSPFAYEVRAFFSAGGMTFEDPVTGSLNASLAQWLIASGRFTAPYRASQGAAIGHAGVIHVSIDATGDQAGNEAGKVWIGGAVTTCIAGSVDL